MKIEEYRIKILITGAFGVGKTSLIERLESSAKIRKTDKGKNSYSFSIKLQKKQYLLNIYEFNVGGPLRYRDKYRIAPKTYLSTINGAIFILDVSDTTSHCFDGFPDLLFNIEKMDELYFELKIPFLVIGNKIDAKERDLSLEQVSIINQQLKHGKYVKCSAKTGQNVDKAFFAFVREIYKKTEV